MSNVQTTLEISENGLTVLEKRYLRRDESGNILETPEEMFQRIAKSLASVENKYPHTSDFNKSNVSKTNENKIELVVK